MTFSQLFSRFGWLWFCLGVAVQLWDIPNQWVYSLAAFAVATALFAMSWYFYQPRGGR